jgi:hypothetical protein
MLRALLAKVPMRLTSEWMLEKFHECFEHLPRTASSVPVDVG